MNHIFNPKSVALIGATERKNSVGRGIAQNLLQGLSSQISKKSLRGQGRKIFFVNPNKEKILSKKSYKNITDIEKDIDLAIIAVPAKIVPQIVKDCIKKQVKAIIIISSGFAEIGDKKMQIQIQALTKLANIDLIGPNCLGVLRPSTKLNASFAPLAPKEGNIALISQSGALLDSIIDFSSTKNYGFSAVISYGNEAGLKLTDFLKWADNDPKTKVIALYLEGLQNGREFFEITKKIKKPIVVLKGGKTEIGKKAVSSHTGALAGKSEIYSAAFKQAGLIEVNTIEELLDNSKALAWQPKCKNNIAVITNGGGAGILTADYCNQLKINLTPLSQKTKNILNKNLQCNWSKGNPIDIVGDALANRYKIAIENVLKQKNVFGLIIIQTMQIMTEGEKNAKVIIEARKKYPEKPIVCAFIGGSLTKKGADVLEKNKIPNYNDPLKAVKAIKSLTS
jgi:acetyl coenzyme A synthetase (ADP forming)-like protein